jgi:geranylgeranyl diphosphate synthase type II
MPDFDSSWKDFQSQIERNLAEVISKTKPDSLKLPFQYLIDNGGKRLRPILTMISAGLTGADPKKAINIATAIEILHNFTLVHDDIMDGSPLRRGKPSVHKKYGDSAAILVGDVMIGYACALIPKDENLPNIFQIQKLFMDSLIVVCEGQAYDMDFNQSTHITVDDYIKMIGMKTSNLLKNSLLMGAYVGNPDVELIQNLTEFSDNMGLAFQIQDDYLDLTADAEFGKTKAQDLIEGKKTHMIIRVHQLAKEPKDRELIDDFYQNHGIKQEQIPAMLELIERLGVFEETIELARDFFNKAEESLAKIPENEYKIMLEVTMQKLRSRKI